MWKQYMHLHLHFRFINSVLSNYIMRGKNHTQQVRFVALIVKMQCFMKKKPSHLIQSKQNGISHFGISFGKIIVGI